ncbi:cupredoxin domain-containing protein [Cohnella sp. NL03-T5]|nr:cupredoxin domain-containing protein [Cohnella silvisoli]
MNKWIYTFGVVLAAVLIATGCGGGNSKEEKSAASPVESQAAGAAKAITIEAKNFEFDQKEIKVKKGETVSITLKNSQGNHGIKIEGYDKEIKKDQTVTFTADQTGEFKFACSIICGKGHAEMTGKLIVE